MASLWNPLWESSAKRLSLNRARWYTHLANWVEFLSLSDRREVHIKNGYAGPNPRQDDQIAGLVSVCPPMCSPEGANPLPQNWKSWRSHTNPGLGASETGIYSPFFGHLMAVESRRRRAKGSVVGEEWCQNAAPLRWYTKNVLRSLRWFYPEHDCTIRCLVQREMMHEKRFI